MLRKDVFCAAMGENVKHETSRERRNKLSKSSSHPISKSSSHPVLSKFT